MDSAQQRKSDNQHPLTNRSPGARPPIGGKFVAHGMAPSTFRVMPAPRRTTIPALTIRPSGPLGQSVRLSKLQRNSKPLIG